jgi:apolipoprotein N-acyltransferase
VIKFRLKTEHRARYALAVASGILLALAFPKFSIAGLAWIAPGMLLFASLGTSPGRAFRVGYVGGFAYYLTALTWLLHIPVSFFPILGWIALSAFLALYTASFVWLCWKLFPMLPCARLPWDGELMRHFMAAGWGQRTVWALKCGAVWVAVEMTISRFLSGFPWDLLGVSQYRILPLIQIASVAGVYGVSFLIIWFSTSLLSTGIALSHKPMNRTVWAREIILPAICISVLTIWGMKSIRSAPRPESTTKMALIQPSIPQTLIWDERENENRFRQLLALSEQALTNNPDILVWPEASVPNPLRYHDETSNAVIELTRKYRVWAILGSDDAEPRPGGKTLRDLDYFNSAFAISPDGKLTGMYRKRQLVIFGEYIPFVKQMPFMKYLSPIGETGFTPGTKPIPFRLDSLDLVASVLICFEDTFPHLVREYVEPNTDVLVNLTNNGWFGESAAQWQHAATAVFRAVENRIPLVRCANNGLTCWVDSTGAMHDVRFEGSTDIYKAGFKIVNVPVLAAGETRSLSLYTRYGDVFGWTCVTLIALNLLWNYVKHGFKRKLQHRLASDTKVSRPDA